MNELSQFDAGYNYHEDRILLRITNLDGDEFRLWLTRRLCKSLLTEFKTKTGVYRISTPDSDVSHIATATATAGSCQDTVLLAQLEQRAAISQQDFSSKFRPGKNYPLGEQGLVVEKVNLKPHGKGKGVHALSFQDSSGKGVTMGVTVEIFNSIFEVVERVVTRTQWDLPVVSETMQPGTLLQ